MDALAATAATDDAGEDAEDEEGKFSAAAGAAGEEADEEEDALATADAFIGAPELRAISSGGDNMDAGAMTRIFVDSVNLSFASSPLCSSLPPPPAVVVASPAGAASPVWLAAWAAGTSPVVVLLGGGDSGAEAATALFPLLAGQPGKLVGGAVRSASIPYSTSGPGFGNTTSCPSPVWQLLCGVPEKMLALKISGKELSSPAVGARFTCRRRQDAPLAELLIVTWAQFYRFVSAMPS